MISVQVSDLLMDPDHPYHLDLELKAGGVGLTRKITIPRIQKPGLALTGDTSNLDSGRVQVFGNSELRYMRTLKESQLKPILQKICQIDLSAIVVTHNNVVPKLLIEEAEKNSIPLLTTKLRTSTFIHRITKCLEDKLTASVGLHGVLMDVYGVGILIIGKSGIGKSEAALDLILRGQRLVADDVVQIKKKPPSTLFGMSHEMIKYHMEIRGLGIINIEDLFGVAATRDRKVIEIVVELVEWNPDEAYDRLGLEEQFYSILDTKIPYLKVPVRPGRNLTTIIEVAARNHLLKQRGRFSAQELEEELNQDLAKRQNFDKTLWDSLE